MRSYLHRLSFPVQRACVVNALFILLFMQRFTDAASLFQHRLRRRLSHSHWRGNKYIARDGILPYQRCGVNNTVAHADPLYAEYQIGQASYSLIVLAASVWGQSRSAGKAPLVDAVEFLAFDTLSKRACALDTGNHCMTFMNATHAQLLGEIRCEFDLGESNPVLSAGSIRPPKTPGFNAFVIACPVDAAIVSDHWRVTLSMGGAVVPVDICYDHVDTPVEVALCMETAYGYSHNNSFWTGNPGFGGGHTMVDAALTYHTELMGAHVRFNDIDSDALDAVLPYTWDGRVSYRSGWRLSPLLRMPVQVAGQRDVVAFEVLVDTACQWEFRYRARWTGMISSVDNFAAPLEDVSLVEALKRAPIDNVSTMLVPIVEGFSKNRSLTTGSNVLLRYPVAGPELAFGDARHTPIVDPRHLEMSWIHWATEFRPHDGHRRLTLGPQETLEIPQVHALHLMAMTRPERDKAGTRSVNALFWKRGLDLEARLERRTSEHLQ